MIAMWNFTVTLILVVTINYAFHVSMNKYVDMLVLDFSLHITAPFT